MQKRLADNVRLEVECPERLSRSLLFVKWLLAIPLHFVLIFYSLAPAVLGFANIPERERVKWSLYG